MFQARIRILAILSLAPVFSPRVCFAEPQSLNIVLEPIQKRRGLPALAAAVIEGDKIMAIGAVGVRKMGAAEAVTVNDRWHLGSNTKSMTATLIARLVEQSLLSWELTLAQAFPELAGAMHADYRNVTLAQLLSHRGGVPEEIPEDIWAELWRQQGTTTEQRMVLAKGILKQPPQARPGTTFIYSNAGYAIAGAIAEKITGRSWEDLMRTYLFAPLNMKTAGFGASGNTAGIDQPWGHASDNGKAKPIPPGPDADNPSGIAPAGAVHVSLEDWAKYASAHLSGARGSGKFLKPESFQKLHTPLEGQNYAMGWAAVKRDWAGGKALTHAGSNTMWYALIWLAPKRNFGVLIATNDGGDAAEEACDEVSDVLIRQFLRIKSP